MITLPTAKVLLFIALNLGPQSPQMVYVTNQSDNFVWTQSTNGWSVEEQGFPTSDFTRRPGDCADLGSDSLESSVPPYLRAVAHHNWSHDSDLIFDNGDRVEKRGKYGFYIVNAGGPNEKIYTILYPTSSEPETKAETKAEKPW